MKENIMQKRKSLVGLEPRKSIQVITAEWEPFAPIGPQVAYHAACIIRGGLFVHGGVTQKDGKEPSHSLHRLDLSSGMWSQVKTPGTPALSHHCAVAIDDRYMLLIGGWNGRLRTPDVHAYDVQEDLWLPISVAGFPEGAGLSSHTANLLSRSKILVIGREGSLRTQRRHGCVYMLSGTVESGHFKYSEYSQSASSRSGHTSTFVGNKLYIIGGRSDHLIEVSPGFSPPPATPCTLMKKVAEAAKSGQLKPLAKMPCGRKHHVTVAGPGMILVYGGDTFDGRSREPVGEMIVIHFNPGPEFYSLGVSRLGRAGHVVVTTGDCIIMHGGLGGRADIFGDAYQLKLFV
ncbi:kelch domain-containing protein 9-like [Babylonia areolata]|uniref:kelch domain-containing protein 9-like n=1 Tax=Babylonia areolata TaxID=304850 RepID=UPI003FD67D25